MAITIKCPKCGNENPLGDLFCRQCGNELDMNALDPGEIKVVRKHKGCRALFELIFLVVIFAFFGGLACMFIAPPGVEFPSTQDDVYTKRIDGAAGALTKDDPAAERIVKQADAGGVMQQLVVKESGTYSVITVNNGLVNFSFRKLYYGFPFTFTIVGKLEDGETGDDNHWQIAKNTVFSVVDTKVGMVPATRMALPHIRKYFLGFLDGADFKALPEKLLTVKLTPENDFSVTLANPQAKK